ncbi:FAS1-like dehydratase domain-containing protein [Pseudoponticoccus marisrubri]|uniref:Acyl-CoA dehydrogenase n=1 Tax=Pseudoponticoccus marisrubri TaxID=1685382 RepID=A0A0W7WIJ6_9RHOB|nr:MaoC family dehydratase N-terminal domain-containing protein [Pseudoponticoccus marisrubri]KUF10448.1 acyl-CoA dehydrogenase [Pseudoponticoccus marisrubri]
MAELTDWIGRTEEHHDVILPRPARFMQATLDRTPSLAEGDALPPLWHWLYFLEAVPASGLGRDAHPKRGGFLPPVDLPRRMWAGGRLDFAAPLVLGQAAVKRSTILDVTEKSGRSGPLCFVTVRHEILTGGQVALTEEHDIVYRADPDPAAPAPVPPRAPEGAEVTETVQPTQVMLFRYSALTFNGHRIHYDVDYARQVEGYEGLVFHGPLTATLLADLATRSLGQPLRRFSFRGTAPLAGMAPFTIAGRRVEGGMDLWAARGDGAQAMQAEARV